MGLIGLFPRLRVKARQNADLAGRSFVLAFAGGILNSGEPPRWGLGGGSGEIQLDGQGVVIPDDQAPRGRGLAGLGLVQDEMAPEGDGFVGSHALENTFLMLLLRFLRPARQFHHHDRCRHDDRAEDRGGRNHLVLGLHVGGEDSTSARCSGQGDEPGGWRESCHATRMRQEGVLRNVEINSPRRLAGVMITS